MTDSLLKPHRMGILLLLISFGTISAVVLTPALPELAKEFGISDAAAQLTMSLFLVGYAIGQLPYGPIANRWGRKKAVYIGIALMLVGSLLALAAGSYWMLLAARFLQALGAAVGLKITFTMISDQHAGQTATKAVSLLSLAFAIMPAAGVTLGGYLIVLWGWRGCFAFLSLYAVLMGFLVLALPETGKTLDREAMQWKKIVQKYRCQFLRKETVLNGLIMGFISSIFYLFATLSPFVGISYIGLAPDQFGLWNLILCVGLFGGVAFTQWFAKKNKPDLAIFIGGIISIFFSGIMVVFFLFGMINVWTLFLPATLMRFGTNPVWSNASSNGLEESSDKSNTSAVMQFINLSTSTAAVFLAGAFSSPPPLLLPSVLLLCSLLVMIARKISRSA